MAVADIIAKKRDGGALNTDEIAGVVSDYLAGRVSDAQMAALLMAVVLQGMSPRETSDLTLAMVGSGERLDLSAIPGTKVDKHSTGGVGDKTTLVVAPLVASLAVPVPKMSGRALGHTGGTIDKLETIPGLTTDLSPDRFRRQVAEVGVAIAAQSDRMAPADKRIYALRDATATVESVPLIASSVMSKKLAAGADAIVLDVKAGRGGFMPDAARARALAEAMVEIGHRAGKRVTALVTRMDDPLGRTVGDASEMTEAIETLAGRGEAGFVELCEIVAGHMLVLGGAAAGPEEGRARARAALTDGRGLAKLREMVAAQGGDVSVLDDPTLLIAGADEVPVEPSGRGYVAGIDARRVGAAVRRLKRDSGADKHLCGVCLHVKPGAPVADGPVASVRYPAGMDGIADEVAREVRAAYRVAEAPRTPSPILMDVVDSA